MADNLAVRATEIPGMFVVDLIVHGDGRGWFKENYQREKMEELGLPHFDAVQNNFSYNADKGVTRGLHAEPWDKYISMAYGKVFGAWVDLRKGDSFGRVVTMEITPEVAIYVPRGVANGYQTLDENATYAYLVNAHWSADAQYVALNLFDPALGINWPFPKDKAITSEKDLLNQMLSEVKPMEFV